MTGGLSLLSLMMTSRLMARSSGRLLPTMCPAHRAAVGRARHISLGMQEGDAQTRSPNLCIVDGFALAYRMHFALQGTSMSTVNGEPTHALHGFCTKLLDLHERFPGRRMVVAFDRPEQTFRSAEFPAYKAQRPPMPDKLRAQLQAIFEAVPLFGALPLSAATFEADDVIAACVAAACEDGIESVLLVSSDKDLLQLVSADGAPTSVALWNDAQKVLLDAAAVEAKFGVAPEQMGDLLALMGDASDNVPGVPGVGPKGAAKLLVTHGDLEAVLAAAGVGDAKPSMKPGKRTSALVEHADVVRRSRGLVQLRADAPIDASLLLGGEPMRFDDDGLEPFLRRWELWRVARKAAQLRAP
jgi:DNA polymerase-1